MPPRLQVDVFAHDLLLIPVHLGMHWCLACVDLRRKAVRYFDSMLGNNNRGLDAILRYLRDEHADKKKQPLDTDDWEAVNEKVGRTAAHAGKVGRRLIGGRLIFVSREMAGAAHMCEELGSWDKTGY